MRKVFYAIVICLMIASCTNSSKPAEGVNEAALQNIMSRKSVRSYTSEPIPDEMVETLLHAGMAAPTAMNVQPWEFIVINDRDTLNKLAGALKYAKMLEQAPLAIVVCAETMFPSRNSEPSENRFWQHDASAAAENILLAAEALGLGAVWTAACGDERADIVCETLGITGTVKPLCVIPVGFPAGDDQPKDKWKPEKIHYNHY